MRRGEWKGMKRSKKLLSSHSILSVSYIAFLCRVIEAFCQFICGISLLLFFIFGSWFDEFRVICMYILRLLESYKIIIMKNIFLRTRFYPFKEATLELLFDVCSNRSWYSIRTSVDGVHWFSEDITGLYFHLPLFLHSVCYKFFHRKYFIFWQGFFFFSFWVLKIHKGC